MNDINIFHSNCDFPIKFYRRKDLTMEIRLYIAFIAVMSNKWGIITQMAKQFSISRTFVYMLQTQLNTAVEDYFYVERTPSKKNITIESKTESLELALLLRLEGKCSIPSISDILKRMGLENSSVGSISQKLSEIGRYLPNTLYISDDEIVYVFLAADELYLYSRPILISVDPISSVILRIELGESRKTEDWVNHFNKLKENGIDVVLVISDEGQGICSATTSAFPEITRQSDTFHAISHRLGKWVNSMENSAYAAIADEYHCEDVFMSAKSKRVLQKRMDAYLDERKKTDQTIMLYEDFKFLYHCIINELQVFDKDGNPRDRKNAEDNIRIALDYMIGLPIDKIKKEINTIYNLLDDLLEYLDTAKKVVQKLNATTDIPQYIIQAFSLAWQYQKNATKAKKSERRRYFANKTNEQMEMIRMILNDNFESVKTTVFFELNKIIQSSAIVENINSIVRAFLNTSRNRINQEMLNLIMFYHNYRRYKGGKRKGKTPMELLTGIKQEKDWLEMLLEIEKEQRVLSPAA